jgi:hypothetical protein
VAAREDREVLEVRDAAVAEAGARSATARRDGTAAQAAGPVDQRGALRIVGDVDCDLGRVQELLRRGEVTRAAEEYQGALLPHSEAPGVVRERDALERWVRHAVMTSDDREALWAWLQSPAGRDDLPAWKALLTHLDYRDPRRSRAAARVGHLRSALATG